MRDIGKNIRDLREQAGLTQEAFAEKLFVTRQTVSNYENGKTRPDVQTVIRIAEILETDANHVLYGLPLPPNKQLSRKRLMPLSIVFCIGWIAVIILWPIARNLSPKWFFAPSYWLNYLFLPLLWTTGGFLVTELAKMALRLRCENAVWKDKLRRALLIFWIFCVLLVLSEGIFYLIGDIFYATHNWVDMSFSLIKPFNYCLAGILLVTDFTRFIWAFFGIFYALLLPGPPGDQ